MERNSIRCAWRAVIVSAVALGVQGCAGRSDVSMLDPLAQKSAAMPITWDDVLALQLNRPIERVQALRDRYVDAGDARERRRLRDEIAFAALALVEEHAQRSRIRLATARAAHDAAGDLAVIGLTTAATLTGGEAVKSALAAAAAAVVGANHAIDARFLNEQTTAAIIAQMDANHRVARERIEQRLRTADDSAYPLAAVDLDLIECVYAGTAAGAVAALADEAALRRASAHAVSASSSSATINPESGAK